MTGAFFPWGRRCPRPRPRTDEGRACGGCPLKGDRANSALISRLLAAASPEGEAFRAGGSFSLRAKNRLRRLRYDTRLRAQPLGGKPLELTGAFSPWGRRCPRPRPRTDEGRACGCCPLKGRLRELRPHQPPAGGSPSGKAFRADRSLLPLGEKVSAAPPADG